MVDDDNEEPLILDSQEERELRTQVCQQAAEVHACISTCKSTMLLSQ